MAATYVLLYMYVCRRYTPLHYSLMVGNELSHIILNNADTDVNMMDGQGRGALHCAVLAKKTEYVKLMTHPLLFFFT